MARPPEGAHGGLSGRIGPVRSARRSWGGDFRRYTSSGLARTVSLGEGTWKHGRAWRWSCCSSQRAAARPRLEQWRAAAETAEGISSFDELSVLTAKSPEFTVICLALELAAGDAGHALNLDCD